MISTRQGERKGIYRKAEGVLDTSKKKKGLMRDLYDDVNIRCRPLTIEEAKKLFIPLNYCELK